MRLRPHHLLHQQPAEAGDRLQVSQLAEAVARTKKTMYPCLMGTQVSKALAGQRRTHQTHTAVMLCASVLFMTAYYRKVLSAMSAAVSPAKDA